MAALSKLAGVSLPYNCYEVGHSWHHNCNTAALTLGASAFYEGLKIYLPLYVVTQFLRGKFSLKACMNILTNVLTSSAFLGFHGFGVIFFSCLLRKYLGGFYFLTYFFIPSFITSVLALMIERKNRRLPLAIYVTNAATETLLRMAAARGIVKPVPNAEIYLFSLLMAINMYITKKYGYSDDIVSSIFKFILGDNEVKQNAENQQKKTSSKSRLHTLMEQSILCGTPAESDAEKSFLQKIIFFLKHSSCPHDDSCVLYGLQGFFRPFLMGYLALSASRCFSFGRKLISNPALLLFLLTEKRNLRLGLFLGGFGATFRCGLDLALSDFHLYAYEETRFTVLQLDEDKKMHTINLERLKSMIINCLLRWLFAKDHATYAIPAGLLGGLFMKFFPSSTISLYLMWKTIENGYLLGMNKGALPHISCFTTLLYALSTALLFHAAVMEAHNLKPSYKRFLTTVTHNRLNKVNHHVLDVFGTQSSKIFSDFYPELDIRYTSRKFQEHLLLEHTH